VDVDSLRIMIFDLFEYQEVEVSKRNGSRDLKDEPQTINRQREGAEGKRTEGQSLGGVGHGLIPSHLEKS
tara:strand:+ start:144 stop:353 length:210 start_codon:yes stop_codon:yes gene_type:complete